MTTEEIKKKVPLKVVLRWKAPMRPFKKRNREYYTTIGAIAFLLAVILLFMRQWMLIAVIISVAFVSYVLAAIEPEEVEHEINTRGIKTGGRQYPWENLERFWFSKKWGQRMLEIETKEGFPGRLMLMLGEQNRNLISKIIEKYIEFDKPEPNWGDVASKWIAKKVPLEN